MAQTGKIQGTVLTSDGAPAEFINVIVKGTTKGATTSSNGGYAIENVEVGQHSLEVSFVGLETREVPVKVVANQATVVPAIILNEDAKQLSEVVISEYKTNPFVREQSEYVAKLPLKDIENPQVYNVISSELLKTQVVTNFDDALTNAPGVEKLWESTGRGGDGAGYYSLRGFAVQPTMVNGLPGLTNGSLDIANIEAIEVIKGPSGTLYGSSLISYGGLINVVTKKPYHYGFGGEVTYTMGSFGLNRVTADVNALLNSEKNIALRLVSAYHHVNSFQDAGFRKSFFVAPSLSYEVNDRLSFLINTEFYNSEGTNPTMLFLNRSNALQYDDLEDLNYDNELSLTSNDITIKNPRFSLQGQMFYKLSDSWKSQTAISRSFAKSDGYYSYLWDFGDESGSFGLYITDQNATTNSTDIQQNFIGDFKIGTLRNRMVVGLDYFQRNVIDNSTGYSLFHNVTPQGLITDPVSGDTLASSHLSRSAADAATGLLGINNSNTKEEIYSAYISDVINFTPKLSLMASLRVDYFNNEGEISIEDDNYDQMALSPKFGVVYQPILNKLSVFANYMNGFSNVGPQQVPEGDTDGDGNEDFRTDVFEPEHANQVEVGIKTNLFNNKFNSTISYYNIRVANRVFSMGPTNFVQGGEVESKGVEVDIKASPIPGLSLMAGYSFNESEVIDGAASSSFEERGKRPAEAGPKNLFNAFATYSFTTGSLTGFGAGFGANVAGERVVIDSEIVGRFVLPGYTVFNMSLFYNTDNYRVAINVDNLSNEEYYKGWSTINPQSPRRIAASFAFKF